MDVPGGRAADGERAKKKAEQSSAKSNREVKNNGV